MVFQSGLANFDILLLGANREGFVFKEWAFNIIFICRMKIYVVWYTFPPIRLEFKMSKLLEIGTPPSARGNIEPPRMNFLTHI